MEEVPDLGSPPDRLSLDVQTVRDLIADQFPQWDHLPIIQTATPGWDNFTFRLGDERLVRLPSAAEYALAVAKEHRWLPELAEQLPFPIPVPLARGLPGSEYPYPWSVYGWLPGQPAAPHALTDPMGIARDVAAFLEALRRIDATNGPPPGLHNWFRGATLRTYDATARGALAELEGQLDIALATAAWEDALSAPWDRVEVWFHGDLAPGNLLVERGGSPRSSTSAPAGLATLPATSRSLGRCSTTLAADSCANASASTQRPGRVGAGGLCGRRCGISPTPKKTETSDRAPKRDSSWLPSSTTTSPRTDLAATPWLTMRALRCFPRLRIAHPGRSARNPEPPHLRNFEKSFGRSSAAAAFS